MIWSMTFCCSGDDVSISITFCSNTLSSSNEFKLVFASKLLYAERWNSCVRFLNAVDLETALPLQSLQPQCTCCKWASSQSQSQIPHVSSPQNGKNAIVWVTLSFDVSFKWTPQQITEHQGSSCWSCMLLFVNKAKQFAFLQLSTKTNSVILFHAKYQSPYPSQTFINWTQVITKPMKCENFKGGKKAPMSSVGACFVFQSIPVV